MTSRVLFLNKSKSWSSLLKAHISFLLALTLSTIPRSCLLYSPPFPLFTGTWVTGLPTVGSSNTDLFNTPTNISEYPLRARHRPRPGEKAGRSRGEPPQPLEPLHRVLFLLSFSHRLKNIDATTVRTVSEHLK